MQNYFMAWLTAKKRSVDHHQISVDSVVGQLGNESLND